MIVHRVTGLFWRFFIGAVINAVEHGRLDADDARIAQIVAWLDSPGAEVCTCGLDLDHAGTCEPRWWR